MKNLDRSANGEAFDATYQESLNPLANHLHQIFTFLFVVGDSLTPQTIANRLFELALERNVNELPNSIVAFEKHLITECCDEGVCPNPMAARGIAIQTANVPSDVLLRFYLHLGRAIDVIRTASLPYWEYLSEHRDLETLVLYSAVDDPPPYLGNWTSAGQ